MRDNVILLISLLPTGMMEKELISVLGKNFMEFFSREFDWGLNGAWNIYKILVECSAIFWGLVNVILFSITTKRTEFKDLFNNFKFVTPS